MRVFFRADASLRIGTGHVMRSMTLAEELAVRGARVEFMCRPHEGNLIELIEQRGFHVVQLPLETGSKEPVTSKPAHASWLGCHWETDAQQCRDALSGSIDWMIVDHYALDHRWEIAMRDKSQFMMCIDDLADRKHNCDVLLDQSLGRCEDDYRALVPKNTSLLLGPKYALLRPEFSQWRDTSLARRETPKLRHVLVTMGGVDADNVTGRVLSTLQSVDIETLDQITVVLGPHAPWLDQVTRQAAGMPVPTQVLSGVNNMAELMTLCDLAIGAGGSTTWERCTLGIPTIQIELAMNQKFISSAVHGAGVALVVGVDELEHEISNLLVEASTSSILQNLSRCAAAVADGSGVEATLDFIKWS